MIPLDSLKKLVVNEHLSDSELDALAAALKGQTTSEIGKELGISSSAARKRLGEVYKKFQILGKGPGKLSRLQQLLLSRHSTENKNVKTVSNEEDPILWEREDSKEKYAEQSLGKAEQYSSTQPSSNFLQERLRQQEESNVSSEQEKERSGRDDGINLQIVQGLEKYQFRYVERYGQVNVGSGLCKKSLSLDLIYTDVIFFHMASSFALDIPRNLDEPYSFKGEDNLYPKSTNVEGLSIAQKENLLMILGNPGMGKSMFLRKIGLDAIKRNNKKIKFRRIPIFIELYKYKSIDLKIDNLIIQEFQDCGFPEVTLLVQKWLNEGRFIILLDGLECLIRNKKNNVINSLLTTVNQYKENIFIISSCTPCHNDELSEFKKIVIAGFCKEQINHFIDQWFHSTLFKNTEQERVANSLRKLIQKPENIILKELSQIPLFLTFLCLIYGQIQPLEENRVRLYAGILRLLTDEWPFQKETSRLIYPILENYLLAEIAYKSFKEEIYNISKEVFYEYISDFLESTLDVPKNLDNNALIAQIELSKGIFLKSSGDNYSFYHPKFQEYFTALFIWKEEDFEILVLRHLLDERWHEVFMILANLMGRRSYQLLESIEKQARSYINSEPQLFKLLQWAHHITEDHSSEYKDFEKRAIAITSFITIASTIMNMNGSAITSASARAIDILNALALTSPNDIISANNSINDIAGAIAVASDSANISIESIDETTGVSATAITNAIARASANAIADAIAGVDCLIKLEIFDIEKLRNLSQQLSDLQKNIPSPHDSARVWCNYADKIKVSWLSALELEEESISLSRKKWKLLSDYLYANALLLRCQHASIGVARKSWETLQTRFLGT